MLYWAISFCLLALWTLKEKRVSRNLLFQELRKKETQAKIPKQGLWLLSEKGSRKKKKKKKKKSRIL